MATNAPVNDDFKNADQAIQPCIHGAFKNVDQAIQPCIHGAIKYVSVAILAQAIWFASGFSVQSLLDRMLKKNPTFQISKANGKILNALRAFRFFH